MIRYYTLDELYTHIHKAATFMLLLFIDSIMSILDVITPDWKYALKLKISSYQALISIFR